MSSPNGEIGEFPQNYDKQISIATSKSITITALLPAELYNGNKINAFER